MARVLAVGGLVGVSAAILAVLAPLIFAGGGAAPAAMAVHHAIDLQRPIACGGVAVFPGDVLVGDEDGVVVVPAALAPEIARDAVEQEELERFIEGKVAAGGSILGLYPPDEAALEAYRRWRDVGDKRGGGQG